MKPLSLLFVAFTLMISLQSYAIDSKKIRYVSDVAFVPIRSGPSIKYRIIHNGLKSGTKLKFIEADAVLGFSKIQMQSGKEGWINSQFLLQQPTAKMQLNALRKKIAASTKDGSLLQDENTALLKKQKELLDSNEQLSKQTNIVTHELEELKKLSNNTIKINDKNTVLIEQVQLLGNKIDSLEAINDELKNNKSVRMFIYGGLLVLITLLLNVWFDGVKRKRSYSSWA